MLDAAISSRTNMNASGLLHHCHVRNVTLLHGVNLELQFYTPWSCWPITRKSVVSPTGVIIILEWDCGPPRRWLSKSITWTSRPGMWQPSPERPSSVRGKGFEHQICLPTERNFCNCLHKTGCDHTGRTRIFVHVFHLCSATMTRRDCAF